MGSTANDDALSGSGHGKPDFVFRPTTFDVGVTVDVANVGQALELLDELDTAHSSQR